MSEAASENVNLSVDVRRVEMNRTDMSTTMLRRAASKHSSSMIGIDIW